MHARIGGDSCEGLDRYQFAQAGLCSTIRPPFVSSFRLTILLNVSEAVYRARAVRLFTGRGN
jgi:hypothetical protein